MFCFGMQTSFTTWYNGKYKINLLCKTKTNISSVALLKCSNVVILGTQLPTSKSTKKTY